MYTTDLYTLTIRPVARCYEPLSIAFVGHIPWRQDVLKCLGLAKFELEKRKESADKDQDEVLSHQLQDDIYKHQGAIEIVKADMLDNYKTETYLAPRSIEVARVQIGTLIWSHDEVWQ